MMTTTVPPLAWSTRTPGRRPGLHDLLRAGHDDDLAFVTPDAAITYAQLRSRVAERRSLLGAQRMLILLACRRDVETLISLLAAFTGGHAVILTEPAEGVDSQRDLRRDAILHRYAPDIVLDQREGETVIDHRRRVSVHALHPDLTLLLSTSGSTGSPKLVRLSSENVLSNARSIAEYLELTPRDRGITTLPLQYCYGLSIITSHLAVGASVLVTQRSVVDEMFWQEADAVGITSLAGVPHTFDLLDAAARDPFALSSLRFMTQAGGRMAPDRVRRWARDSAQHGVDFVVMYGATEATARMAYLPPALAERRSDAIGRAIPGGALRIDAPDAEGVGELVYTGPNVMMGYAESPVDLERGADLRELRTGDVARQGEDGLFEIVGRASRFVKIYGLRVDLDRLEQLLDAAGIGAHAVARGESILIGSTVTDAPEAIPPLLSRATGLPAQSFIVVVLDSLAVTSSGKPDRSVLRALAESAEEDGPARDSTVLGVEGVTEAIRALLGTVLDRPDATAEDSFTSLEGDSLADVEIAVRLERLVGPLPSDWPSLSVRDLAELAPGEPPLMTARGDTVGHARRARALRSLRSLARVETPVVLRAIAIVLIVGTHANLWGVQGGAHLLLGVLGYNLARFQLATQKPALRVRSLLRAAV